LTREGINGYFEMELTVDNKFVSIKKLEPEWYEFVIRQLL
jgi:hypothetical protein